MNDSGDMTMAKMFVLVGVGLLLVGALGAFVVSLQLSSTQQDHDSLCTGPPGVPQTPTCVSIEEGIHIWQGLTYISLLVAGAGAFLAVLGIATRPKKRVPLPQRGYAVQR
jgi:hypothetical protein